jgi:hypothetical protein
VGPAGLLAHGHRLAVDVLDARLVLRRRARQAEYDPVAGEVEHDPREARELAPAVDGVVEDARVQRARRTSTRPASGTISPSRLCRWRSASRVNAATTPPAAASRHTPAKTCRARRAT